MQQIALVTGSSKGIGQATAIKLAEAGYYVYITYFRDNQGGLDTLNRIEQRGGHGKLLHLDVRSEESVRNAYIQIEEDFGYLNVLVSNAVTDFPKPIEETSFDEWQTVTQTKLDGAFLCTKYGIPLLSKGENANLIIITSHEGEKPEPSFIAYGVGTAGLILFTKAMAVHLAKYGIRTNAVAPGTVRTALWDGIGFEDDTMWVDFAQKNPMRHVPTVEDVASAVLMLVQDPTRYLNGNFIYVDGGNHWK